ncbi:hypothetical protein ACFL6W_07425 [Thermodesulfobacteriota bacterium]
MGAFLKKIVIIAIVCAIGYLFMGYHYIIVDKPVPLMFKKSQLTLKYTIVSTKGKDLKKVMSIPELWNDGIGEEFYKAGLITEDELELFRAKMEGEDEGY